MDFFGCLSRGFMEFPSPPRDHDFNEVRGFQGMELDIFRVAKSSGEGRRFSQFNLNSRSGCQFAITLPVTPK